MLERCPYCFQELKSSPMTGPQVDLVCKQKTHEIHIPYAEWSRWKEKQGTMRVCPGRSDAKCSGCPGRYPIQHYACPHPDCHHLIVDRMLMNKNFPVAIIGTKGAGKTVYITMLMNELRKGMAVSFDGVPFMPMDTAESNSLDKTIENMKIGEFPKGTARGNVVPRLYQFGMGDKLTVTTIYDGAGENFNDPDLTILLRRYVNTASGLILLFDPTVLPEVEAAVKGTASEDELSKVTMSTVMEGIDTTLREWTNWHGRMKNFLNGNKIPIPTAVVFCKFDLVYKRFQAGNRTSRPTANLLNYDPSRRGKVRYDEEDSKGVDTEIREWLNSLPSLQGRAFIAAIEKCFSNVRFFGVSSLGRSPVARNSGERAEYTPHRVTDPMVWLMHEASLIK